MTHIPETYHGSPDPMDPNSAYGEGKRVGELLCATAHKEHGVETTVARCFAFVGPHLPLDAHFAIGNFIRDAIKGEPIKVKDGTPYRSYLYAADLAIWLWTILFAGWSCHPYNVGSNQGLPISDLAKLVALQLQVFPRPDVVTFGESGDIAASPRYIPGITRAKEELGLAVEVSLDHAIQKTANWVKAFA
jgi:dTDP-glucose 4,6-dehydratase